MVAGIYNEHAACRKMGSRLFFSTEAVEVYAAKAVCRRCPVMEECLAWALTEPDLVGVWGGTTTRERRRMRRAAVALAEA